MLCTVAAVALCACSGEKAEKNPLAEKVSAAQEAAQEAAKSASEKALRWDAPTSSSTITLQRLLMTR